MKLTFKVNNQILERTDRNKIVADSRNYLYAEFDFLTKDWDGITKTAIFRKGNKPFKIILDEDNSCLVPWEVLECGTMFVSVFGGDLITTNSLAVSIMGSGYSEGETPSEPTPDVYNQILERIKGLEAGSVTDEQIAEAVEGYLIENPIGGEVSEEQIAKAVNAYMEENGNADSDNAGTEVSKIGAVGLYDASSFSGDIFSVIPTSESYVASGNFLKFEKAGTTDNTTPLVEGESVTVFNTTITLNTDGSVTINGTPSTTFYILSNITDEFRTAIIGQTAKISLFKSNTASLSFSSGLAFNDATYGYNLTNTSSYSGVVTSEKMSGVSRLEVKSGVAYDNLTVSAMLELQNDKGYLSEYTKSDCQVISESTEFSIADYPFVGIVGDHTITYKVEGGAESVNAEEIATLKEGNPLYGKKVACLGDSLCYGQGFSGGYCTVLAELEKDTTFVNKGVGGSQISSNHANGGSWWIENQLSGVSEDTDYIVCEGYVNDYLTSCELGSISEGYEAELDTTTFYGGMESLCKALANNYTDRRYGFIIAHSHYSADSAYENKLYIEAIKECCDKWGIPYLDLSKIITPIVPIYESTYYTDGLHYNEAGYRRITPAIRDWIKTL